MALSYRPLWVSMAKKGLKKTEVIEIADISTNVKKSGNTFEKP